MEGIELFIPVGSWADWMIASQYESDTLQELARLAQNGGVLYDIGGHVAYFTSAWIKLGGRQVETFEPVPANYQIILNTLERNQFRIRCVCIRLR